MTVQILRSASSVLRVSSSIAGVFLLMGWGWPSRAETFDVITATSPHHVHWKMACVTCHKKGDASPKGAAARFVPAFHNQTTYPLFPPHDGFECTVCHPDDGTFEERFHTGVLPVCAGCHDNPHGDQFFKTHTHCLECHRTRKFVKGPIGTNEHTATFPLTGQHRGVACVMCHVKDPATGIRRFSGNPKNCSACHQNHHRQQISSVAGGECRECHSPDREWGQVVFRHDAFAQFKLGPAHQTLACTRCHPRVKQPDGEFVIQFHPLNKECRDCHGPKDQE